MKVKCELTMNTDSGDYELQFWNLSRPGESLNYSELLPFLKRVFSHNEEELTKGIDSDDQTLREIH